VKKTASDLETFRNLTKKKDVIECKKTKNKKKKLKKGLEKKKKIKISLFISLSFFFEDCQETFFLKQNL